jgi:hypothetical protein
MVRTPISLRPLYHWKFAPQSLAVRASLYDIGVARDNDAGATIWLALDRVCKPMIKLLVESLGTEIQ